MRWLHGALFALAAGAFVYLIVAVGPQALWSAALELGWGVVWIVLLGGVEQLFHALGWWFCFDPARRPRFAGLFGAHLSGHAVSSLTPTATVGGEVVRGTLLVTPGARREALAAISLDRLTYAVVDAVLGVVGAVVLVRVSSDLPVAARIGLVVAVALVTLGIIIFLLLQRRGRLVSLVTGSRLVKRLAGDALGGRIEGAGQAADDRIAAAHAARSGDLLLSGFSHLLGNGAGAAQMAILLYFVGAPFDAVSVLQIFLVVTALDLTSFFVPGRLGAQEGARMLAMSMVGVRVDLGLLLSLAQRVEQLAWSGVGVAVYPALIARRIPAMGEEAL